VGREQQVLLADALERLPADYREVIILRNLEDLSYDEIAQRMGRTPGAVRMLWVRALAQLRAEARQSLTGSMPREAE
jgi:RNA polymerase sigma-70 factor, ECF subfamily